MILGSRPDQRYAGQVDRQIYIRRNNYKFKTSRENNIRVYTVYWNTGKGADLRDVVVNLMFIGSCIILIVE